MFNTTASYVIGHSAHEQRRHDDHGAWIQATTERFLRDAGIGYGMRVLDAGCGTGDVSLLVGGLVGPTGMVLGVDRSADALASASDRVASRGLGNVQFVQDEISAFAATRPFDAVVGRLVLASQPDPVATLRQLGSLVRPGGIVAFQDIVIANPILAVPPRPLLASCVALLAETFTRIGGRTDMGLALRASFVAAGLPAPRMRLDGAVFDGADPGQLVMLIVQLRALLPEIAALDAAAALAIDIDTLLERLVDEGATSGGAACSLLVGGAWTRTPSF